MSYLEQVRGFRKLVGLDAGQPVELHNKLIREELAELADALADSVFVIAGKCADGHITEREYMWHEGKLMNAARHVGILLDVAVMMVLESNNSKLCTEAELRPTELHYNALGMHVEFREVSNGLWAAYCARDTEKTPKGKLLKSTGFFEPRWNETDDWLMEWRL